MINLKKYEALISNRLPSHSLLIYYSNDMPEQGKLNLAGVNSTTVYHGIAKTVAQLKEFAFCEWVNFMVETALLNHDWNAVSTAVDAVLDEISDECTDKQAYNTIGNFADNWEYATSKDDYRELYEATDLRATYVRWFVLATLLHVYNSEFLSILDVAKKRYEQLSGKPAMSTYEPKTGKTPNSNQENVMTTTSKLIGTNKTLAMTAATLEAGRIANNKAAKLISKKLPVMVRGYADTAVGKLVIANLVKMGLEHFKPDNKVANAISDAMIQQAYVEILQEFDIEGFLDGLLDDKTLMNKAAAIVADEE